MLTIPVNQTTGNLGSLYDGLEVFLALDQTAGGIIDSSGHDYTFTNNGALLGQSAGQNGNGADFGGNDYIDSTVAGLLAKFASSGTYSISIWFSGTIYDALAACFGMGDAGTGDVAAIYPLFDGGMGAEEAAFWLDGDYEIEAAAAGNDDGNMHCIQLISRAANDYELWIDDTSIGTGTTSKTVAAAIDNITLGAYDNAGNEEYDGLLTKFKLWSRALSESERILDYKFHGFNV